MKLAADAVSTARLLTKRRISSSSADRGGVIAEHLPEPANRLQRLIFQRVLVQQLARLRRIHIAR